MKQRIITACIALLIFIPILIYGNWPFTILTYVIASIGFYEFIQMKRIPKQMMFFSFPFLWLLLLPTSEISIGSYTWHKFDQILLFMLLLLLTTVFSKNKFTFDDASFLILGILYIGIAFSMMIIVRAQGLNYLLFILFLIWGTDTGAYFSGMAFGKRKLWPKISPKKTIEGAIGGTIIAAIIGLVFQVVYPFDHSLLTILILSILISVAGQLGDLIASALKRHYGVKDFGNILPGHGGIIDRMDSLIFVLLFLSLIQFI